MHLIAAVDNDNGIGLHGDMLYRIPEDLRYFHDLTYGKVVVMGRGTLMALPGAGPLPGRINIILTKNANVKADGFTVCHSLHELFETIAPYPEDEVFVIGGEEIYKQLLDYCKRAYITKIQSVRPADRHFPDIDGMENWTLVSESETKEYEGIGYTFREYENHVAKPIVKW